MNFTRIGTTISHSSTAGSSLHVQLHVAGSFKLTQRKLKSWGGEALVKLVLGRSAAFLSRLGCTTELMLHATSFCALFSFFALLPEVVFRCFVRIYADFLKLLICQVCVN